MEGEDPGNEGEDENATSEGVNLIVDNAREAATEEHEDVDDDEGSPEQEGYEEDGPGLTEE